MRKVLIEKVSNTTRVTTWDTKNPDKKIIKSYNQGANTLIQNDVLIIEDSNNVFPKQRILFSELDENYGTTDIESFGEYLNQNDFFLISGGSDSNSSSVVIVANNTALIVLIANNQLIPGASYKILSADPNLYGGTEITLTAITPSELSLQGSGKFYCPKYDLTTPGYGIWTTYMEGAFSNVVGTFTSGETVTAQNGATAIYLTEGLLNFVSGDWSGATSISGASANADVSGFVSPSYNIGQIVHWGGKSWTNVNGNIGASIDKYTLDAEWNVIPFNETDYNVYVDEIHYDIGNDMIIYRKDRYNNVVSGCNQVFVEFEYGYGYGNPIKDFQWGCAQDDFNTDDYLYIGIQSNQVIDSYMETLNTLANYIWFNELSKQSSFSSNTLSGGSSFSSNTLSGSSFNSNTLSGSSFNSNTLSGGSSFSSNTLSGGSYIQNNTLSGSSFRSNTLSNGSSFNSNTLSGGSSFQSNTLSGNSYIQYNTLSNSYIQNNTLSNSYIQNNNLSGNSRIQNNTLSNSYIENNTFSNGSILEFSGGSLVSRTLDKLTMEGNNIAIPITATIIFNENISKTIFKREDGVARLQYVNYSDAVVITDVNA